MNGAEKIIDALVQLMEGYQQLKEAVEEEIGAVEDLADDENSELDSNLANEVRAAVETFIEAEGFSAEELAPVIVHLTSALEEIEPDIFEASEDEEEDDEDDYDDEDLEEDDEDLEDEDEDEDDDD